MKEEKEEKNSIGLMFALVGIIFIIVIGMVIYIITEPFRVADELRNRLKEIEFNHSVDYKQGWLDCVRYYINKIYGPQNATAMLLKPLTLE